jgi:hypothetical protein
MVGGGADAELLDIVAGGVVAGIADRHRRIARAVAHAIEVERGGHDLFTFG